MSGDFLKRMAKINATFLRDPACEPFWKPVDWKELNLPHYPDIIKHPMDLGTIQKRLDEGYYSSAAECAADFRLVWQNCLTFNKGSEYFEELASKLSKKFEERYAKVADAEAAALGPGGGGATPRTQEPAGPRLPSLADKTQFGHGLYLIGREDLGRVIMKLDQACPQAIERAGPSDVEVNVDAIDAAAFWDLLAMVQRMRPPPGDDGKSGKRRGDALSGGGRGSSSKKLRA
eukprot:TRINITY_DN927_c0_g1_i7.p2 TRINITY_DN927_c0_g1~~TRINITY_DN927_c0_g1_i7.p2  ORF type:complete len:232 (-),score=106.63 TRINITY_DN927_c0_g1_i7:664-1359(-)